jgi:hypothetical protein
LLPVLVKAASTALIVVSASVLAEAIGPFWGGLVTSLPISTGPTYVFLSLGHDTGFLAASALASFAANAATAAFLVFHALTAPRLRGWWGLGLAIAVARRRDGDPGDAMDAAYRRAAERGRIRRWALAAARTGDRAAGGGQGGAALVRFAAAGGGDGAVRDLRGVGKQPARA